MGSIITLLVDIGFALLRKDNGSPESVVVGELEGGVSYEQRNRVRRGIGRAADGDTFALWTRSLQHGSRT